MKYAIVFLFLLICSTAVSQTGTSQKEINDQVWKIYIKAYNESNDELLSSVHSHELARVVQDANRLMSYDEYFKNVPDSIRVKRSKEVKRLELRFTQRIANKNQAFDVGYYKTTFTNPSSGMVHTGYGKFHVLLRKENGAWKILMDSDASDNVNEKIFLTGESLE